MLPPLLLLNLDYIYQRALIEKKYLRGKITSLRNFALQYEVDQDVMDKVEKVSNGTLTTGVIEQYSKHIKPNDRER